MLYASQIQIARTCVLHRISELTFHKCSSSTCQAEILDSVSPLTIWLSCNSSSWMEKLSIIRPDHDRALAFISLNDRTSTRVYSNCRWPEARIDIDLREYCTEFRMNLPPRLPFQMERTNLRYTVYLWSGMKFDCIYWMSKEIAFKLPMARVRW